MWQYNYGPELAHHGIKGMKWGVRRYQKKDGSLTPAGKKKYKANKTDEIFYGKKGAQRIADRRNKGDSRSTALRKEFGRQFATGLAIATLSMGALAAVENGAGQKLLNVGKKAVDSYMNTSILDASGNVINRYHQSVRVGEAAVNALMRR